MIPDIPFLSKPCSLIGFHGNRKAKFAKKYKKIQLLISHKVDKAGTLQNCS